jgi:hypothetical protein
MGCPGPLDLSTAAPAVDESCRRAAAENARQSIVFLDFGHAGAAS